VTAHWSAEAVTPGCVSWSSAIWQTRATLVHVPDGRILFDPTYFPAEIDTIAEEAESGDGERVLLLTHSDWDHVVGFPRFSGWRWVASEAVQAKDAGTRDRIVEEIRSFDARWYVERREEPVYPRVDVAIAGEREVELAGETVLLVPAVGHTDDGLATFFPRLRLLVAGDLLSALEFPFVYHSATAYRRTLQRVGELVRELEIEFLVPGHGPVARTRGEIERRLRDDVDYLDRLTDAVSAAGREGLTGDELAARLSEFPFRGALIGAGQIEFHRGNVAVVERELSSGVF
jgi:hydroxyacylglutathione hydrolase